MSWHFGGIETYMHVPTLLLVTILFSSPPRKLRTMNYVLKNIVDLKQLTLPLSLPINVFEAELEY